MTLTPPPDLSLADHVAGQLREAIVSGRYQAGERLVERKLAGELGVSHIPIREALARLVDEGLVERLPRRGARVAALSERDVEELISLRTLLEQFVAERAQARLTAEREAALRKVVKRMQQAAKKGDVATLFLLDDEFHRLLWTYAEHGMLLEVVTQLRRRINAFLRAATAALTPAELAEHAASHGTLVDALASGKPAAARAAMAEHIAIAGARIDAG